MRNIVNAVNIMFNVAWTYLTAFLLENNILVLRSCYCSFGPWKTPN